MSIPQLAEWFTFGSFYKRGTGVHRRKWFRWDGVEWVLSGNGGLAVIRGFPIPKDAPKRAYRLYGKELDGRAMTPVTVPGYEQVPLRQAPMFSGRTALLILHAAEQEQPDWIFKLMVV